MDNNQEAARNEARKHLWVVIKKSPLSVEEHIYGITAYIRSYGSLIETLAFSTVIVLILFGTVFGSFQLVKNTFASPPEQSEQIQK
jgi:hypothetical protein